MLQYDMFVWDIELYGTTQCYQWDWLQNVHKVRKNKMTNYTQLNFSVQ